jgi:hypothetical protein
MGDGGGEFAQRIDARWSQIGSGLDAGHTAAPVVLKQIALTHIMQDRPEEGYTADLQ